MTCCEITEHTVTGLCVQKGRFGQDQLFFVYFVKRVLVSRMQKVTPRTEYLLTQGQECREAVLLCKGTVNIVVNGVQAYIAWFNLWSGVIRGTTMHDLYLFKMRADPCKHANINIGE